MHQNFLYETLCKEFSPCTQSDLSNTAFIIITIGTSSLTISIKLHYSIYSTYTKQLMQSK